MKVDLVSDEEVVSREEMRERRKLGTESRGYVVESVGTGYQAPVGTQAGV